VPRRQAGLEAIVAGLAPEGLAVAAWTTLASDPALAASVDHLVALDPPPGGRTDPLLRCAARAHLAWGPAEAEFALMVWRAELDLRAALGALYRTLRGLGPDAGEQALQAALCGDGRYPHSPEHCARLLQVLTELQLVELDLSAPACRVVETAARADLERSASFRSARGWLAAIELALTPEMGARPATRAA
jgi:hypothetical protein